MRIVDRKTLEYMEDRVKKCREIVKEIKRLEQKLAEL